ncbi:hypothetical protein MASR1M31_14760 [Porphyromonadaceae bacterium]
MNQKCQFVLLPAIAGLVGWFINGHVGSSAFGAMIPGVMISIVIVILLKMPAANASILVLVSAASFGIGGDMSFNRALELFNNDKSFLALLLMLLKGGSWGILVGTMVGMGFFYNQITRHQLMSALLLGFFGIIIGVALTHEPVYRLSSYLFTKPYINLWCSLALAALFQLLWFKRILPTSRFRVVRNFAVIGLIGGVLGVFVSGLWMFIYQKVLFLGTIDIELMLFPMSLLIGGSFGYAAWKLKDTIHSLISVEVKSNNDVSSYPTGAVFVGLILSVSSIYLYPMYFDGVFLSLRTEGLDQYFLLDVLFSSLSLFYIIGLAMIYLSIVTFRSVWQMSLTIPFSYVAVYFVSSFHVDYGLGWSFLAYSIILFVICALFAYGVVFFGLYSSQRLYRYFQYLSGGCLLIVFIDMGIRSSDKFRYYSELSSLQLFNEFYPTFLFLGAVCLMYYWGQKYLAKE